MLKKTWLYSPFAQKKFERTTFRNAKNNRRKMRGELILPSKRVALIRSCPVDHLLEYPRGCQLNCAFFLFFLLQAVESEACAKIVPSQDSPWRVVPRTILPAFGALSGPNSPFSSWLVNWLFWTQSRNLRCFYENYHVLKNSAILQFSPFACLKSDLTSKWGEEPALIWSFMGIKCCENSPFLCGFLTDSASEKLMWVPLISPQNH